jgi:hypothetical protein
VCQSRHPMGAHQGTGHLHDLHQILPPPLEPRAGDWAAEIGAADWLEGAISVFAADSETAMVSDLTDALPASGSQ